jgi:hypothetical protein
MNKVQTHETICKELNALYARKNADYGDSFGKSYREYGLTMACIRLEDKLNRIKALRTKEAQVNDESILDTLMDLANYSIMTLVEMRVADTCGDKLLPEFGNHDYACQTDNHSCLCNTCRRDNSDSIEGACCVRHNRSCKHLGLPCPDYIPDCDVEDDDEE